jgi:hypothetical protein
MIEVKRQSHTRTDRAGDPLDGLVNLFDLGIVLAVAFLLAALQSLNLSTDALTKKTSQGKQATIQVPKDAKIVPLKPGMREVPVEDGKVLGQVYRDKNGKLIYVAKP